MQSDVPVICSNVTSMPEVAGDATILVDPFNVTEIAKGMERMAMDPLLRSQLIARGKKQREMFSWDRTAALLWESIKIVATEK